MFLSLLAAAAYWFYQGKYELTSPVLGIDYVPRTATTQNQPHYPGVIGEISIQKHSTPSSYSAVRMPYGPNPTERYVETVDVVRTPTYGIAYQKNLSNVTVQTPHYFVDQTYNSPLNNFITTGNLPQVGMLQQISNWSRNRSNVSSQKILQTKSAR